MSEMFQTVEQAENKRCLMAYMHHMAQTAQTAPAKRAFELFAQQETRRMESDSERLSVSK